MKHPKLWDGISSILVLFGLGLYGSCCWYGVWALVYVALGCVVLGRSSRCLRSAARFAAVILA